MRLAGLAFALAIGCGGSRPALWSPVKGAEAVRVVDGVVYRVASDARIEMTVTVTLGEMSAPGSARVAGTLDGAATSSHAKLARARAYLALADVLRATQPQLAFDAAHRGFDEIGIVNDPRFPMDHTDWRETNAKLALATDPPQAVHEMMVITQRRISRYVRLWHRDVD